MYSYFLIRWLINAIGENVFKHQDLQMFDLKLNKYE